MTTSPPTEAVSHADKLIAALRKFVASSVEVGGYMQGIDREDAAALLSRLAPADVERLEGYAGLDDSLTWLKAALNCANFRWDEDQRAAAAESLLRGQAELRRLSGEPRDDGVLRGALQTIANGPPSSMDNSEVAAWAGWIAMQALGPQECEHSMLATTSTLHVIDPYKAKCKVCFNFFDLPLTKPGSQA